MTFPPVAIPSSFLTTPQTLNVSVGGSNSILFVIGPGSSGSLMVSCNPSTGPQGCVPSRGTAPFTWTASGLPAGVSPGYSPSSSAIAGTVR